jgi:hypothetical protein
MPHLKQTAAIDSSVGFGGEIGVNAPDDCRELWNHPTAVIDGSPHLGDVQITARPDRGGHARYEVIAPVQGAEHSRHGVVDIWGCQRFIDFVEGPKAT